VTCNLLACGRVLVAALKEKKDVLWFQRKSIKRFVTDKKDELYAILLPNHLRFSMSLGKP